MERSVQRGGTGHSLPKLDNICRSLTAEGQSDSRLLRIYFENRHEIGAAASDHSIPASIIVAIIDRESAGRNIVGDNGFGFGLMQIDSRSHDHFLNAHSGGLDPASNIRYGAKLLRENFDRFGRWDAALAAYNAGPTRVANAILAGRSPDSVTTGQNYSADVLSRAAHFDRLISSCPGNP